jgi:hypothetical protein
VTEASAGQPAADRPVMPGYGILPADQGSGLLPWGEAERRLTVAHDYWVATVPADGSPHVMPSKDTLPPAARALAAGPCRAAGRGPGADDAGPPSSSTARPSG